MCAVLGAGMFTYYLGRSFPAVLNSASPLFYVVALAGFDRAFFHDVSCEQFSLMRMPDQVVVFFRRSVVWLFVIALVVAGGVSFAKMGGDYKARLSNSTLLRELLSNADTGLELAVRRVVWPDESLERSLKGRSNCPLLRERMWNQALALMDKWAGGNLEVIAFLPMDVRSLLESGRVQKLPISSRINDQLSERLIDRIADASNQLKAGDILFLPRSALSLQKLDIALLRRILTQWDLESLEVAELVQVARLVSKSGTAALTSSKAETDRVIELPLTAVRAESSSTNAPFFPERAIQQNNIGFWSSAGNLKEGWQWICVDLGASDQRVWKVFLCPRPDDTTYFPQKFIIESSLDKVNWTRVAECTAQSISLGSLFEVQFEPQRLRYLRVWGLARLDAQGRYGVQIGKILIFGR